MIARIKKEILKEFNTNIKIMIIEDNKIKRIGLKNTIDKNPNLNVVGTAENLTKAMYILELNKPNIIIMNLVSIGSKGLEMIYKIKDRYPDTKIIILSLGQDQEEIKSYIGAGVAAYCSPSTSIELLTRIITTVHEGACWYDARVATIITNYFPKPTYLTQANANNLYEPLSAREIQVLRLLVQGKSNAIIAKELIVSVHTAKAHVCNIIHKLNATDRVQAAVKAINYKLVEAV